MQLHAKNLLVLLLMVFLSSALFAQQPAHLGSKVDAHNSGIDEMLKKYDKQIYFTQNNGQWPAEVLYKANFTYGQAVATRNGMLVSSFDPTSVGARSKWVMD
ncbi:MAG: hypothetical protein M0D57_08725 [Sphingobacteriales bacterium JAD_PAG50586_3]|nr:MAG: hypothetical protein M0D57_08725 [Sphingobacteriales bacterium JAD_PAG50586_3]